MGYQIELDEETIRRIRLAWKLAQTERDDVEVGSLDEYVERILTTSAEHSMVVHTDFDRTANDIWNHNDTPLSEYIEERIDQLEADIEAEIE